MLVVATADPTNINNLDNLSRLIDRPVEPVLATPEEIARALNKYYGLQITPSRICCRQSAAPVA